MYRSLPVRLNLLVSSDSTADAVRENVESGCVTGGGPKEVDGFSLSILENVDSGLVTGGGPDGVVVAASGTFSTAAATTSFGLWSVVDVDVVATGAGNFSACAIVFSTLENGDVEVEGVL